VFKLPEDTIEDIRFNVIKKMLTDFPELKDKIKEYLKEDNENKE
jgi:hypothetical protein